MKYDRIYYTDGSHDVCFNISGSVGYGGDNLFEDVMLVQSMLKLVALYSRGAAGLSDPDYNLPEVTGAIDADTYTAIGQFQIAHKSELMMKAFDGRIDPAHYKGRRLRRSHYPVMTIMLLHFYATDAAVMLGTSDTTLVSYQKALEQLNSKLATMFDMALLNL
jgi:hypothetical protein